MRAQLIRDPGKNISVNQLWEERVRGEREKESEMEESDREEKNKEGRNREEEPKNLFLLTELNTRVCVYVHVNVYAKIPSLDKENTSN